LKSILSFRAKREILMILVWSLIQELSLRS